MPPQPQPSSPITYTQVTWYSKALAVILFVALVWGAFHFGIWYQYQKQQIAVTIPPASAATEGISYPAGFSDALSNIPTDGWKTYKNKNGWEVQYPADWAIAECMDGAQIRLRSAYSSEYVGCDGPSSVNFWIIGPSKEEEAMYNPRKARIAQQFQLNGLPATRYLDALCGHSGKDFCEIVLVARDNRYYSLSLDPGLQYKLIAEKILSTFKFSE